MPAFTNGTVYDQLQIKPPIQFRMQITKQALLDAKAKLGTTVGNQAVTEADWALHIYVCPTGQPDCTTPVEAIEVFLKAIQNSPYQLHVLVKDYYTSPNAEFTYNLFNQGQEVDVNIDIVFQGTMVMVSANGITYFNSDMLKTFEQVRKLSGEVVFKDANNNPVSGATPDPFNVQLLSVINWSQLLSVIIPLSVVGVVIGVLPKLLQRVRA